MRRPLLAALGAACLFAAVTPWVLRPWFLAPDALPRAGGRQAALLDADLYLNVWILAWTAHAVTTGPARLFDGNIYYPAPNTLAGSESMLAHLPVTVPVLAATGSALTVLKAMALESFIASGLAMFLFVYHHARSVSAALVAGAAFTFAPWRVHTLPQPQYLGAQYLPLALLAVDCWLAARRRRALAGLAAATALQALACFYLGYFTFVAVPIYAAARLVDPQRGGRAGAAAGVLAALAAGALLAAPAGLPYLAARALRTIPEYDPARLLSTSWPPWAYLQPQVVVDAIGVVPVAGVLVAGLGGLWRGARGGPAAPAPARALWILGAAAIVLSAGPYLEIAGRRVALPYLLPYWLVPGFSSLRGPSRFFIVACAAGAALVGIALARASARWPRVPRVALALAMVAACAFGAAPGPASVMPARLGLQAAPAHRWLAAQPSAGAVLDVPASLVEGDFTGQLRAGRHMLASTVHWHPILDGYTAYPPPTADFFAAIVAALPAPEALALLADTVDVRWLVVHGAELPAREREGWRAAPGLAPVAEFGADVVYTPTRPPARPWREEILPRAAAPAADTLEGTPTAPLAAACRAARGLAVDARDLLPAPTPVAFPVRVENASGCVWPALGVRADGLVGLTYRWVDASGHAFPGGTFSRFLADVPPGALATTRLLVFPPDRPGRWRLEVALVQEGTPEPLAQTAAEVEVRPFAPSQAAPRS